MRPSIFQITKAVGMIQILFTEYKIVAFTCSDFSERF
jgi:hypothetical protein